MKDDGEKSKEIESIKNSTENYSDKDNTKKEISETKITENKDNNIKEESKEIKEEKMDEKNGKEDEEKKENVNVIIEDSDDEKEEKKKQNIGKDNIEETKTTIGKESNQTTIIEEKKDKTIIEGKENEITSNEDNITKKETEIKINEDTITKKETETENKINEVNITKKDTEIKLNEDNITKKDTEIKLNENNIIKKETENEISSKGEETQNLKEDSKELNGDFNKGTIGNKIEKENNSQTSFEVKKPQEYNNQGGNGDELDNILNLMNKEYNFNNNNDNFDKNENNEIKDKDELDNNNKEMETKQDTIVVNDKKEMEENNLNKSENLKEKENKITEISEKDNNNNKEDIKKTNKIEIEEEEEEEEEEKEEKKVENNHQNKIESKEINNSKSGDNIEKKENLEKNENIIKEKDSDKDEKKKEDDNKNMSKDNNNIVKDSDEEEEYEEDEKNNGKKNNNNNKEIDKKNNLDESKDFFLLNDKNNKKVINDFENLGNQINEKKESIGEFEIIEDGKIIGNVNLYPDLDKKDEKNLNIKGNLYPNLDKKEDKNEEKKEKLNLSFELIEDEEVKNVKTILGDKNISPDLSDDIISNENILSSSEKEKNKNSIKDIMKVFTLLLENNNESLKNREYYVIRESRDEKTDIYGKHKLYEVCFVNSSNFLIIRSYRTYSHFSLLHKKLKTKFPYIIIPELPPENYWTNISKILFQDKISDEDNLQSLNFYINFLYFHEDLRNSKEFYKFVYEATMDINYFTDSSNTNSNIEGINLEHMKKNYLSEITSKKKSYSISLNSIVNFFVPISNSNKREMNNNEIIIKKMNEHFNNIIVQYKEIKNAIESVIKSNMDESQANSKISGVFSYLKDCFIHLNNYDKIMKNYHDQTEILAKQQKASSEKASKLRHRLSALINLLTGICRTMENYLNFIYKYDKFINKYMNLEKNGNNVDNLKHQKDIYQWVKNKFETQLSKETNIYCQIYDETTYYCLIQFREVLESCTVLKIKVDNKNINK